MIAGALDIELAHAPSNAAFWVSVAAWALVAVLSTAAAVWIVWRQALAERPAEWAFRSLARGLGLTRGQIQTIRSIAAEMGKPPVALLLCPDALTSRMNQDDQTHPANDAELRALLARLGAIPSAERPASA
ncbi:MAG: hypothetical protein KF866_01930 [Phycisphaeraceae bacterium]|nr:hypothetical protein [Phycisphaeraceae bacterium]MCW5753548.1 hypothetical protein [Phycisphaeraceae bacterium]